MSVLVDTCIWSLGLRRRRRDLNPLELRAFYQWEDLLKAGEASITGAIRQEILSGIPSRKEFDALVERLSLIDDLTVDSKTYERAAEFFNTCRGQGILPGAIDMTICAAAEHHDVPIFTSDPDFDHYARCLPIRLLKV